MVGYTWSGVGGTGLGWDAQAWGGMHSVGGGMRRVILYTVAQLTDASKRVEEIFFFKT